MLSTLHSVVTSCSSLLHSFFVCTEIVIMFVFQVKEAFELASFAFAIYKSRGQKDEILSSKSKKVRCFFSFICSILCLEHFFFKHTCDK